MILGEFVQSIIWGSALHECGLQHLHCEGFGAGTRRTAGTGWVKTTQPDPTPRDEGMFINGGYDPVLGELVYPVMPDEWGYFALNQTSDTAKYIMYLGAAVGQVFMYLGFPLDE